MIFNFEKLKYENVLDLLVDLGLKDFRSMKSEAWKIENYTNWT